MFGNYRDKLLKTIKTKDKKSNAPRDFFNKGD